MLGSPPRTLNKIKNVIRNYIWSGGNGERRCRAKVEWDSLIQHRNQGGIMLIDPTLQMQALLTKLMIRGLMPREAPWRIIIQYQMKSFKPKRRGKWPSNIHFIMHATRVRSNGFDIWWAV